MFEFLAIFLPSMLRLATPLALGALSGIFSERAGVINIAIEGMMLLGAFIGFVVAHQTGSLWLGVLAGVGLGAICGLLHGFFSLHLKTDQIISGTAVNILAIGITGYFLRTIYGVGGSPRIEGFGQWSIPGLSQLPVIGPVFQGSPITFLMLLLVVLAHVILFKTTWGLRTRAVGEHPLAAATVGIKVFWVRYVNLAISGMLAGLAGVFLTLASVGQFTELMTNGKGFIALAVMIFGKWNPIGGLVAALLFGGAEAAQIALQNLGIQVPYQFLLMIPYALTMIVLAGLVGKAQPPAALGKPYPSR